MKQSEKYLKIFANLFVAVLTIFFVWYVCPKILVFFLPFVVGYVISLIANPLVRFLERHLKFARGHSSFLIIVVVLAGVILLIYLAGSKLMEETGNLIHALPEMYESFSEEVMRIGKNLAGVVSRLPQEAQDGIADLNKNLSTYIKDLIQAIGEPTVTAVGNFAKNVPGTLIAIVMGILSAYFFTADHDKIIATVKAHIPLDVQERVGTVLGDLKHVVGGYFKAQFKIMLVIYLVLVVGLLIMRVNYVLLVALLIAFLDMLPFFGTGTVLVPWAIIKLLSGDYKMAIGLIVLYGVTQLVRQIVQPKIMGDTMGLNPLAALFFMYIGYQFSSVIGMIVAVPLGMIIINLYRDGVFDNQIHCVQELVKDFNKFRKL